ncbi:MAG: Hcp family type VI secretion system effector [Thermodesulfobacteriota bacterium]|nr:Hcp family type VI secretion system effector [Thermodesulfobacteriota bacterium]MDY6955039.1 Hcp family type VI secretion system effector [Thermodesulfobacteriota bacterium]
MPMPAHLEVEGENQGAIEGSCDMEGREGTILVYAMNHDVHIPRDPQSGLSSGRRIHGPVSIVKEYDKSSPKLYQALCTGEHMKSVILKWYRIDNTGSEEHYFTHTLENAIVVEMKPYMPMVFVAQNEPYRHMEEVAFTYEKIKWTWEVDGIEAEDSWLVPK